MKWILYVVAVVASLIRVLTAVSGFGVFRQTAGLILLLVGTTSFGFAAKIGKLDRIEKQSE